MELTKEQIQYIDNLLKKEGIKYWDIRIEMLDHIATDIEQNAESDDFTIELKNSLNHLGWLGNLSYLNTKGWKDINKFYRRKFHEQILNFFKQPKTVTFSIVFIALNIYFSQILPFKVFTVLHFIFFALPILLIIFFWIKNAFKKHGKSIHLNYGVFYSSLSIMFLNPIIYLLKYFNESTQKIIFLIIIPIYLIASYSGFLLYKSAIKKVEQMKKELSL